MWIHSEVEALVKYTRGQPFPALRAIRWGNRRIDFREPTRVERETTSLNYLCTVGLTRYSIRFEPMRQTWWLEAIDDSGLGPPGENPLPPGGPSPPDW